jgi:predicted Zn-dependent peptidase
LIRETEAKSVQLANGLTVIALETPGLHRAHLSAFVRVGSRFESREHNGVSHFLEHMLYRGTNTLANAHAVNRAFEKLGGSLDAATHVDYGMYSVTLPLSSLPHAVPHMADVLANPTFKDIDVERHIVCEEILEDLDEEGRDVDADNCSRQLIYPSHPLGFTITGSTDQVNAFSVDELKKHHRAHYTASNMVIVLAGAFRSEEALRWTRPLEQLATGARVLTHAPVHAQHEPRFALIGNASSQAELRISFRTVAEQVATRATMELLLRVIDDGMSTRLYHRICDTLGLCYDVSANYDGYEDDGLFDVSASVNPEQAPKLVSEVLGIMTELAHTGPTEEELSDAKSRARFQLEAQTDSPEELAAFWGISTLFERAQTPRDHRERLEAVTCSEVQKLAQSLCTPAALNVVAVGNPTDKDLARLEAVVRTWRA